MNLTRGHFIVVEGLEGAGKSTAIHAIEEVLTGHVKELVKTHEPGGTQIGDVLRNIIKQKNDDEELDARAELLLLYASRIQLVENVIKPAINRGAWVLSDRFEMSTKAYQGGGRGITDDTINSLSKFCLQGFVPDLIIFLDVTPELGLERALARSQADRIEQESLDFFNAVYARYKKLIALMPQVVVVDASQSMPDVALNIKQIMRDHIERVGNGS